MRPPAIKREAYSVALPDETARGVQQLDAGGRSAFLGIAEELGITDRGKIEVRGLGLA